MHGRKRQIQRGPKPDRPLSAANRQQADLEKRLVNAFPHFSIRQIKRQNQTATANGGQHRFFGGESTQFFQEAFAHAPGVFHKAFAFDNFQANSGTNHVGEIPSPGGADPAGQTETIVGHFIQTRIPDKRVEVVRAAERWTVKARSEAGGALNYRYQSLSHGLTEKLMQPFIVEVPPGQDSALNRSQHEGEEFLFVLAGVLEVEIAGERHRLEPGDAIYYDSRQPHTLRALEGATARLIACIAQHANVMRKSEIDRAYR